ncbi:hypothetical protein ACSDR0_45200 [Streptosporangium sp. G11]|uniref:hypothetical protein n=1 Tax=Streptosporangium sp. G11 TaxID=3436926 RepID=UPI003EB7728F
MCGASRCRVAAVLACLLVMTACTGEAAPGAKPPPLASRTPLPEITLASEWQRIEKADEEQFATSLRDVAAWGPDAAWAIGYSGTETWNGVLFRVDGARWRVDQKMSERFPGASDTAISGIDADGPDRAWAVGNAYLSDDTDMPYALRWDGHGWRTFAPLGAAKEQELSDVAMDGARAALIGNRSARARDEDVHTPLLLTWDGRRFTERIFRRGQKFEAVAAGGGHTWIVGTRTSGKCADSRPAIWHSASPRGTPVPMPLPDIGTGVLTSVWQNGPSDVWATGERGTGMVCDTGGKPDRPVVMHWDGTSWKEIDLPGRPYTLHSVTAFGPDDVWLAGTDDQAALGRLMLLRYDGQRWTSEYLPLGGAADGDGNEYALTRVPGTAHLLLVGSEDRCELDAIICAEQHAIIYRR